MLSTTAVFGGAPVLGGAADAEWATNLDFFHYAFVSASLLGVALAFFNDDVSPGSVRWSWIAAELLPVSLSSKTAFRDIETTLVKAATQGSGVGRMLSEVLSAARGGQLFSHIDKWRRKLRLGYMLYWQTLKLRCSGTSRRQLFYQAAKVMLHLENRRHETEIESYLDIKRFMKSLELWPFAFEVSDVKNTCITCEGVKAYQMSSYSYLDFIREPLVQEAALAAGRAWATGNHGARMLGGNATILRDLEQVVGRFFGRKDSLLCATGFLATMSGVCAVAKEGDLLLADSRVHASLRAGMKLSGAREMVFRHNNWQQLQQLLSRYRSRYRNCWVIVESVYSMDGDIADLPTLKRLATRYHCKILLDEAHGLGVLGKTGRGLEEYFDMPGAADVIIGTFSKSIAGVGGFITGDQDFVEFLDFHALGSVFSAPLTAYSAGGAIMAFRLMQGEQSWRIGRAQQNAKYLRKALRSGNGHWPDHYPVDRKFEVEGVECTTVIPVVFPNDPLRVCCIGRSLLKKGWVVGAAIYPACPMSRPRIRITATAAYTREIMDKFVRDLVHTTVGCAPTDTESRMPPGPRVGMQPAINASLAGSCGSPS